MPAGCCVLHRDHARGLVGILLDHDRVGTARHGRAGEDAHRFAASDAACEAGAGKRGPDQLQRGGKGGHIGGTYRIAVHGRGIERRLGETRGKILGQHAASCPVEPYRLGVERLDAARHARQSFGDGKQCHQRLKVPERPPVFSSRRMPEKDIARSTALHMS